MLRVDGIEVYYGAVRALDRVNVEVKAGSATAVLGANGAGKTTLLRTISGVLRPRRGAITYNDMDLVRSTPRRIVINGVSQVPEGRHVFSEFSVEDNLSLGMHVLKSKQQKADATAMIDRVYELFPRLLNRRKQAAGSLSGGEQQMLAIGRALASLPTLLMLDEPTLGLSPIMIQDIYEGLAALKSEGLTLLLVEQSVGIVSEFADSAYVLANGHVTGSGSVAEMLDSGVLADAYLGGLPVASTNEHDGGQ